MRNNGRRNTDDGRRGLTLTELLVASAVSFGVLLAIMSVDVFQRNATRAINQISGVVTVDHGQAAQAGLLMSRALEAADRANIPGGGAILQVRIPNMTSAGCAGVTLPPPGCFNDPANYRWDQFSQTGANQLVYYPNVLYNLVTSTAICPPAVELARQITTLTFQNVDQDMAGNPTAAPPGGDPVNQDNNVIAYTVQWNNGSGMSHIFRGKVTLRSSAYTDVSTGLQDPGQADSPPLAPPPTCS